jgi:hypothetical protein
MSGCSSTATVNHNATAIIMQLVMKSPSSGYRGHGVPPAVFLTPGGHLVAAFSTVETDAVTQTATNMVRIIQVNKTI